jgi:DNA replication protein DnaC
VRCYKIPKLAAELTRAHALQRRSNFLKQLATADLLVLDDLSASSLTDTFKRDLLEILDDRYDRKSTLVTSQLFVSAWHAAFADPTLADAILDRLVHNAYKLEPNGESIRKLRGLKRSA